MVAFGRIYSDGLFSRNNWQKLYQQVALTIAISRLSFSASNAWLHNLVRHFSAICYSDRAKEARREPAWLVLQTFHSIAIFDKLTNGYVRLVAALLSGEKVG